MDEVGRGCIAGPVAAAALVLPERIDRARDTWLDEVADSKLLAPAARERLAPRIEAWAGSFAVASASVEEIDRLNIYHAAHLAMRRALDGLAARGVRVGHAIVDGNRLPRELAVPATAVVKGDLKCLSVAAASILAKVWRDRLMIELDDRFPGYGFAAHKGYGTPAHLAALGVLGACPEHRRSFSPVAQARSAGTAPASATGA